MGIHHINGALLGDPKLDHRKPEILLYEPQPDGTLRLVAIEWMVLDTGQEKAPRILGQTFQGPMTHNGTAPRTTTSTGGGSSATPRASSLSTTRA
jgi:hypothetical protein